MQFLRMQLQAVASLTNGWAIIKSFVVDTGITPYMQGTCKQYTHLVFISRGNLKLNGHLLKV